MVVGTLSNYETLIFVQFMLFFMIVFLIFFLILEFTSPIFPCFTVPQSPGKLNSEAERSNCGKLGLF